MNNSIKKISLGIAAMIIGGAIVAGVQLSGQSVSKDIPINITEAVEPDGTIRYDLHYTNPVDDEAGTSHFWGKDQLKRFALKCDGEEENCKPNVDITDTEDARILRKIVESELKDNSVDQLIDDLKKGKEYTHTKEQETLSSKIISAFSDFTTPVYADDSRFSRFPGSVTLLANDPGAATSNCVLDSAMVYGTSGDSCGVYHQYRESQTNGDMTVWWYCTAESGTPNEAVTYIYPPAEAGEDTDRPDTGGTPTYTSGNMDASGCGTAGWISSAFTGVTTVAGDNAWFLAVNTEADAATNQYTLMSRPALDKANTSYTQNKTPHQLVFNTDGWTTDGTPVITSVAPMVVCYASGNCYGNPYVAAGAAHASNANLRGNRFTPSEDLIIQGFWGVVDTNFSTSTIVTGSTKIFEKKMDVTSAIEAGGSSTGAVTATGEIIHDFLQWPGANDTFGTTYTEGNSPPAGVQNAGSPFTYVDCTAIGSCVETTTTLYEMTIEIGDNPAISGGGGTTIIQPPGVWGF